jgi:hypothetical protein
MLSISALVKGAISVREEPINRKNIKIKRNVKR